MNARAIQNLHALTLGLGGAACLWGMAVSWNLRGIEATPIALERGGTSAVLLILTVCYGIAFARRRSDVLSLFAYPFSFILLGVVTSFWLRSTAKSFAPASTHEASRQSMAALVIVFGASAIAVGLAVVSWRRGARQDRDVA